MKRVRFTQKQEQVIRDEYKHGTYKIDLQKKYHIGASRLNNILGETVANRDVEWFNKRGNDIWNSLKIGKNILAIINETTSYSKRIKIKEIQSIISWKTDNLIGIVDGKRTIAISRCDVMDGTVTIN